jgi:NAD(P)-dependent dehydrogenase (short-subunit alcohol dehydrogenase family)
MSASETRFTRRSTAEEVTAGVDLRGKVALITGANSGLGHESMRVLARRGAHVIGAARTLEKAQQACALIEGDTTPVACELSDLDSVAACANQVLEMGVELDILMCNAGIMALSERQHKNGIELQFLTNHLGHFLLVNRLLERVIAADQGRVVLLSSGGHTLSVRGGIDFENLSGEKGYNAWKFYGQSKLANILMSNELSRRLQGTRATSNAVHPGVIRTNLARNTGGFFSSLISVFAKPFERTVEQGAATQCYVAAHPDLQAESGRYFADCKQAKPSQDAGREELAARLWQVSEQMTGDWR